MNFEQSPLPLTRIESLLPDAKIKYQQGAPFLHFVFDDFFDDNVVEKELSEFPGKMENNFHIGFANKYSQQYYSSLMR